MTSREFGPYFVGNATSASGTWFHSLAASLLVYRLTGSEFLLGVLNFSQFAAVLVLAPWIGSAADRFDRRKLLLVTQSCSTVLSVGLAMLAFAGHADEWTVIGFTVGLGVGSAFSAPAQQALITSLVRPEDLSSAVALNSMTFNLARAVGPALAAAAVATVGIPAAFLVNAGSYLVLVVALLLVHPRPHERPEHVRFRDSLRLVASEPRLAAYLLIVAAVGYASDPVNTLAPAIAEAFGRPDAVAGLIIGAFGAGAVTAAFVLAGRTAGSPERMAATLVLLSGGMIAAALTPWLPLAFVFLFAAGFGYLASNTSATTRLQLEVSEGQRGRIMALWSVAFLGLRPIASLIDGALAAVFGVRVAMIALVLPALVGAVVVILLLRRRAAEGAWDATGAAPGDGGLPAAADAVVERSVAGAGEGGRAARAPSVTAARVPPRPGGGAPPG